MAPNHTKHLRCGRSHDNVWESDGTIKLVCPPKLCTSLYAAEIRLHEASHINKSVALDRRQIKHVCLDRNTAECVLDFLELILARRERVDRIRTLDHTNSMREHLHEPCSRDHPGIFTICGISNENVRVSRRVCRLNCGNGIADVAD